MAEESRSSERTFAESPPLQDLIASDGTTWTAFRSSLRPRYGEVWKDLALIFCCWLGGFSVHVGLTASLGNSVGLALLPVVASWLGFWMAAIGCFTHEAAHFCIHPDRRWNDRLANVVLCPLTLNEIERYRARHWQHHLHLGNSEDTEISYRNIPGTRFVLESLFGIQLLGALHRWNGEIAQQSVTIRGQRWPVLLGVGLHLAVVLIAWWAGVWSSALTWTAAVVFALPFWLALRQLLEHRPLPAEIPAGADSELAATNRMFPSGFFSRFFGAAGFNRHLLHHWYPQASYSCFDDLEAFLMTTELGPRIDAARTEYLQTWRALVTATRTSDAA